MQHTTVTYEHGDETIDAISVADAIGADRDAVFKTLVATGDRSGVVVFVVPGTAELDLKKAARASGNKSVDMLRSRDLLSVTGYIRGGCSPVGMKKQFPTYLDETAQVFARIHVSAGMRGMQMLLAPADLLEIVHGSYADLI